MLFLIPAKTGYAYLLFVPLGKGSKKKKMLVIPHKKTAAPRKKTAAPRIMMAATHLMFARTKGGA